MKFATKPTKYYPRTLDMEENANELHVKCTDFNSSMHIILYAESILCLYKNLVLDTEYHVDC